jgi:hypothetical protein
LFGEFAFGSLIRITVEQVGETSKLVFTMAQEDEMETPVFRKLSS